jgi:hypothetical protein
MDGHSVELAVLNQVGRVVSKMAEFQPWEEAEVDVRHTDIVEEVGDSTDMAACKDWDMADT